MQETACSSGDLGSILGLRRSSGEGNGNPLQYFCLGNPMNRGAWRATVRGVTWVGHNLVANHHQGQSNRGRTVFPTNGAGTIGFRVWIQNKNNFDPLFAPYTKFNSKLTINLIIKLKHWGCLRTGEDVRTGVQLCERTLKTLMEFPGDSSSRHGMYWMYWIAIPNSKYWY